MTDRFTTWNQLTGTATVNIPGIGPVAVTVTLTNTSITISGKVNIPGLGPVSFTGTLDAKGNFTLTGTTTVKIPGLGSVTVTVTVTSKAGLTTHIVVQPGSLAVTVVYKVKP